VSTLTHPVLHTCPNCGADLPLEALACPSCHTLVHGERLDQLARDARALELRGSLLQARELWVYSLTLLPPDSKQTAWVHERLRAIDEAHAQAQVAADPKVESPGGPSPAGKPSPNWVKKFGPFGPAVLLLFKLKGVLLAIFKLKFLFSFAAFVVLYIGIFGWRYGLGISACILIHEMGHYIDIKRRGLPAEMPVFLPGLGAYVKWNALGVTRSQIAQIALAGPLAGWIAAALCFLLYAQTRDPIWAALARTGAVLNTLNLIPVWVLDGGTAAFALDVVGRAALLALTLAVWFYTGEGIFFLVAVGFAWRLFTKDKPQQSDWGAWAYYAALLIALGVLFHATPNTFANQGLSGR
jgi:Zn-dependent protease